MLNKFVIIISGSTGTGKTDFAQKLGQILPIEIVNADIGSFYKQLTIGTAKPDWQSSTIPHHFFDILDQPINWTAPQFRQELKILLPQIWERGNIPVIVGGSAFYIQSFFYKNYELLLPDQDLIAKLEMQSSDVLWKQLHTIDAQRAEQINPQDQYRLVRALAIWYTQGQKPSDFAQIFDPLSHFYFINLTRDREQLYSMINQRVDMMMQAGWLQEVQTLMIDQSWIDFLCKKKMIGYDDLIRYQLGHFAEQDYQEVLNLIKQRTRNYAKRQITFLKRLIHNVQKDSSNVQKSTVLQEYDLTQVDIDFIIQDLLCKISV